MKFVRLSSLPVCWLAIMSKTAYAEGEMESVRTAATILNLNGDNSNFGQILYLRNPSVIANIFFGQIHHVTAYP
jgi:hypothetical protein